MDFRKYIRTKLLKKNDRILEFGPLIRPLVSKRDYPNIFFADVRSTEDIKKLYTSNDYLEATGLTVDINSVVGIDYVITKSYTETFKNKEKFDVVYLSHVIEHMPDIISFFKDVANIIKNDGKLVLIYPDARYCFDHFRNGSTFVDAYDVYKNKSANSKAVLDFTYNVLHENNPAFFWSEKGIVDILPQNKFEDALESYDKAAVNELPDDVHFWPFSDYQFVKFLYDMDRAGLLDFEISDFHETQQNTQEFMIVLTRKTAKSPDYQRYQKILAGISPVTKANIAREEKQALTERVARLEQTADLLKAELEGIYSSKKWRYASKAADIKQSMLGRKHGKV
jgi:SAM-dependent methyltransferase